jgi:hypothetical protein
MVSVRKQISTAFNTKLANLRDLFSRPGGAHEPITSPNVYPSSGSDHQSGKIQGPLAGADGYMAAT